MTRHTSRSGKGKLNIILVEDVDLNPKLYEEELREREKRDKELDALNALKAKFEAEEKNVEEILASTKAIFPDWNVDQIQKEAINYPKLFLLEPRTSFSTKNESKCQLDFLITTKAFQFRCFKNIMKVPLANVAVNKKLLFLRDKHLYSTTMLNQIVDREKANKSNNEGDVKCVSNMLKWWIVIRMTLLKTIPKILEVAKNVKEKTTTTT
ncbi:unnamed protein product [Lactuca saligna]|uniref:Uncharacterized protein n=1 Tax=Lactuca saligna TaxID=75948 RepID=A0AA35ZG72_LACSI|nr:unnamed protein product [Lactuca saligna]